MGKKWLNFSGLIDVTESIIAGGAGHFNFFFWLTLSSVRQLRSQTTAILLTWSDGLKTFWLSLQLILWRLEGRFFFFSSIPHTHTERITFWFHFATKRWRRFSRKKISRGFLRSHFQVFLEWLEKCWEKSESFIQISLWRCVRIKFSALRQRWSWWTN